MAPLVERDPTGPGQESVWDYPRPPRLEATTRHLRVTSGDTLIAETVEGFRVLETSHPPSYYFPPGDCDLDLLIPADGASFCEWKGHPAYWDVSVGGQVIGQPAWSYLDPTPPFVEISDYVAFYPAALTCTVDGEQVTPQPGYFYGGWVTPDITGPFKGPAGTQFW